MAPFIPFIYFFFLILLSTTKFSFTQADTNMKPILSCTNTTATATDLDSFTKNYNSALSVASVRAQHQGFGFDVEDADKKHSNSTIVYAYGECLKGLAFLDSIIYMSLVYDDINGECLQKRKGARGGRAFRGHCLLRYDDHDFRGEISSVADESLCSYYGGNQTNSLGFQDMAGEFLRKMSIEAPKNGGFYFGMNLYQNTGEAIFGAAQCLKYVNDTTECERCLTSAATKGKECLSRPEGIVLNYGCFMTYAPYNFYRK